MRTMIEGSTTNAAQQDIKKTLVMGSGPIVIGQAAEFDYAGTQACRILREEGIERVPAVQVPARRRWLPF